MHSPNGSLEGYKTYVLQEESYLQDSLTLVASHIVYLKNELHKKPEECKKNDNCNQRKGKFYRERSWFKTTKKKMINPN